VVLHGTELPSARLAKASFNALAYSFMIFFQETAMARAQATTDHTVIRRWIETRKGHPSVVRATEGKKRGSAGLLRVDFEPAEESLEEISWDDFFDTFDSSGLAFLFQEEASGGRPSRFHKFVSRDSVEEDAGEETSATRGAKAKSSGKKVRQASPAEEEEAEEADEEDVDDLDEDEDEDEDDEDEDEDEDEDLEEEEEDEDEDLDDDDDDDDDEELDDEDEDEKKEEEVKPKRKR
jgi:hypothetical protein